MNMFRKTQSANITKNKLYDVYVSKNNSKKVLYILGPYAGKKYYFYPLFFALKQRGYRVVFMQAHRAVLSTRHPEYLESAVVQARAIINSDRKSVTRSQDFLLGLSLGSYLGLSVLLTEKFKKFIVIGGGAPLVGVFKSHSMFRSERKKMSSKKSESQVYGNWVKFDEAFKSYSLDYLTVLAINSKNDRVVPNENLNTFYSDLKNTGAIVLDQRRGYLPHIPQVLSANFRARQIDRFFSNSQ